MTSLDDLTLMQWFVSGDATLEANQSLRIQPANKLRQLLGRKGALLATAYDATLPPSIEVRRDTDYSDVLHQILIDHHFVPIGQGLDSQVLCYSHYPIPDGYRIVYGQARQLWKQWWTHPSRLNNRHLQLDLFVLAEKQWYPVRNIAINSGTLYVETLRGETVHHGDDTMVWLEKDRDEVDHTHLWEPPVPKAESVQQMKKPPPPPSPQPAAPATAAPQATIDPTLASPIQQVKKPPPPPPMTPSPRPAAPAPATAVPQVTVDPTLAPTVYALDGKVYVQTAVGLVIIEGDNLNAYSASPRPAAVRQRLRHNSSR